MKERIKQKLKDARDRITHRVAVLVIRGIARTYGVKLPEVQAGAWLMLRTKNYTVMFQPAQMPSKDKLQMLGWSWVLDGPDSTRVN